MNEMELRQKSQEELIRIIISQDKEINKLKYEVNRLELRVQRLYEI